MAREEFNKDAVQFKCATFTDGKTNFFSLASGYWYPETNLPHIKGECTLGYKSDKEYIKYLQRRIEDNDFHDTKSIDGTVFLADWFKQVAEHELEVTKQHQYRIVYHDAEHIYDYETKEPIMSVKDYLTQVEAYASLKNE